MSRVLLIGGAGFLGHHLLDKLLENGYEVTVQEVIPKETAVKINSSIKEVDYLWKSLIDISSQDLSKIECVICLAGQPDVPLSISSPKWTWFQNTESILTLIDLLKHNPRKSIFMSSDNVYGHVPIERLPITEKEPLNPPNLYAASKGAMELIINSYINQFKLPFVILRCASIYGEYSRPKQVVPSFIRQALEGQTITIEGDGSQTRDFNYARNTASGIINAMESDIMNGTWNIGSGKETSIKELAETIIKLTGSQSKIAETEWRPGEKGIRLPFSIEKAKKELGYNPEYSMEDGLKRTIEWLKSNRIH